MIKSKTKTTVDRREVLKMFGVGSAAGMLGLLSMPLSASAKEEEKVKNLHSKGGMPPVTIRSVKAIGTAPAGSNLVIVKVETSEPGLYGLGCATFTQRAQVVVT
ncbi:MAG: starvation-sensing protein RspA, partial [Ginsengibacter sp.]